MTLSAKAIKNGCPRCWHCLNRLMFKKGGGYSYREVTNADGTVHRVHAQCLEAVLGDGIKEVKQQGGKE